MYIYLVGGHPYHSDQKASDYQCDCTGKIIQISFPEGAKVTW